ncbi:MAG: glucokinase [Gammaproteobacteria bacterium]|nr:glucokinase [Gammaproteobacteria bacterium]
MSHELVRLIADIGGTNARFALLSNEHGIHQERVLACADYSDISGAIKDYFSMVGNPLITEAALALATPIVSDQVKMTNNHWSFSIDALKQQMGFNQLIVKNDFTALAMSIPLLSVTDLVQVGGVINESSKKTALALVGAGTGLGVSGLIPLGDLWVPLEGEGGHVTAAAANDREFDIIRICRQQYPHVSAERLVSGMGLQNLYQSICTLEQVTAEPLTPQNISDQALDGSNAYCVEALDIFCGLLGSVAGDVVLTLGAYQGVYIGGGIVPKLGSYFAQSSFRQRFEAKGRFNERLKQVPAFVIDAKNPALLGIGEAFTLT